MTTNEDTVPSAEDVEHQAQSNEEFKEAAGATEAAGEAETTVAETQEPETKEAAAEASQQESPAEVETLPEAPDTPSIDELSRDNAQLRSQIESLGHALIFQFDGPREDESVCEAAQRILIDQRERLRSTIASSIMGRPVSSEGLLDFVVVLRPFLYQPAQLLDLISALSSIFTATDLIGRWDALDKSMRIVLPVFDDYLAKVAHPEDSPVSGKILAHAVDEAKTVAKISTVAGVIAHGDAKITGLGDRLKRLRELLEKAAETEVGQIFLQLALKRLLGGLA